jgi:GxxExxY protein
MQLDQITQTIIGSAIRVHTALGPGLLESAYRICLRHELILQGLKVESEVPVPIIYRGLRIDIGYRLDLLVEDEVVVECKAVAKLIPLYEAQLLSHLRLKSLPVGLLINFHVMLLRDGIRRMVNQMPWPHAPTDSLEHGER